MSSLRGLREDDDPPRERAVGFFSLPFPLAMTMRSPEAPTLSFSFSLSLPLSAAVIGTS